MPAVTLINRRLSTTSTKGTHFYVENRQGETIMVGQEVAAFTVPRLNCPQTQSILKPYVQD